MDFYIVQLKAAITAEDAARAREHSRYRALQSEIGLRALGYPIPPVAFALWKESSELLSEASAHTMVVIRAARKKAANKV